MKTVAREILYGPTSVAQNATVYSNIIDARKSTGDCAAIVVSTAGSITITQQCSDNKVDWYDAVDATGSTAGEVCSAQGVTTGIWVALMPVLAPYVRYKIVEGNTAATTVTLTLLFGEES